MDEKRGISQASFDEDDKRTSRIRDHSGGIHIVENTQIFEPRGEESGIIKFTEGELERNNRDMLDIVRERSSIKEKKRAQNLLQNEAKLIQKMHELRLESEKQFEMVSKTGSYVNLYREYNESLTNLRMMVSSELAEKLKYKNKARDIICNKIKDVKSLKVRDRELGISNIDEQGRQKLESKRILNMIINVKQQEERATKELEKLKAQKAKKEKESKEGNNSLAQQNQQLKEKLSSTIERIKEKNELFYTEYKQMRIICEQIVRRKRNVRILAVLMPLSYVDNAFLYETYLRLSKNHRSLSIIENQKILEPEKHSLIGLEDRVGNAEEYIQEIDEEALLKKIIAKQTAKLKSKKEATTVDELIESEIISLDEEHNIIQENGNFSLLGALKPNTPQGDFKFSYNKDSGCSSKTSEFLKLLSPDPVKVFNNALLLRKLNKKRHDNLTNTACKFDAVITNDFMSTFFDNNVILRFYAEVEFFIKSIYYDSIDRILASISYDSHQFDLIFSTEKQRKDYNLHYHLPNTDKDTNILLSKRTSESATHLGKNILIREDYEFKESEVRKDLNHMSFVKNTNEDIKKKLEGEGKKSKRPQLNTNLIILLGDENRGLISGLFKLMFDDLKAFDNCAVCTLGLQFQVDILIDNEYSTKIMDNFADFINYIETELDSVIYRRLIIFSWKIDVGSKLNPSHFQDKYLKIVALPHIYDEKPEFSTQLKTILRGGTLDAENAIPEVKAVDNIFKRTLYYCVAVEMPHMIKVSRESPHKFYMIKQLIEFVSLIMRQD